MRWEDKMEEKREVMRESEKENNRLGQYELENPCQGLNSSKEANSSSIEMTESKLMGRLGGIDGSRPPPPAPSLSEFLGISIQLHHSLNEMIQLDSSNKHLANVSQQLPCARLYSRHWS